MRYLFLILCLIQSVSSIAFNISSLDSINLVINTNKTHTGRFIDDAITNETTDIMESNTSTGTIPSTTRLTTTTTRNGTTTENIWTYLKDHIPILVAIIGGPFLCVIIIICICCWCRRRRRGEKPPGKSKQTYRHLDPEVIEMTEKTSRKGKKSQAIPKCPYMRLAKEFAESLGWSKTLFDSSHDTCYCAKCYPAEDDDVVIAANEKYVIPRGWVRIGLYVDAALADSQDIWNQWIVTFHGTTIIGAHSILKTRQFCLPGDKLIDGTRLGIRDGHIPGKKHIYTSPTIAYSSLKVYSPMNDFHSKRANRNYQVQIVLQCRQMPDSFEVQPETVRAGTKRLCRFVPNTKIEYYTETRSSLVAYGLLVKLTEQELD